MNQLNPKVDAYLKKATQWQEESKLLRTILLECGLAEELKWGKPCYAFEGSNVVVIQGFKKYCALLFFKGVLLKDPEGILIKTGANTRVGRQIRFTDVREIVAKKKVLKAYVSQAIEVEKAGLKVDSEPSPVAIPQELQKKFDKNAAMKKAFQALTSGRQRGYIFYFSAAKQSTTREARIEKYTPQILKGKGLNED